MRISLCIFILLGGVVADPIRAQRGALMFLNEALATTAEIKTIPPSTAPRNPPKKPEVDPDSEDVSDAASEEGLTGILKDDSQETVISNAVQAAKPPPRRGANTDEMIRRWVQDRGSRETTDPDSEEDTSPPRAQAVRPSRTTEPVRVLDDGSREVQDLDSLEDNGGRPAPAGNRGGDYDESRELLIPQRSAAAPLTNKGRLSQPSQSHRA